MDEFPTKTDAPPIRLILRLYVAGDAPNSLRARMNLRMLTRQLAEGVVQVDIIDVLLEPLRALEDGILVTPTLVRIKPPPLTRIIGDLSDRATVQHALGLEELAA